MGVEERRRLLVEFNDTRMQYPRDKCLHELFAEQVRKTPDEIAVAFGEQVLSYRQLYENSHDLALYLQSLGVGPDSLVGLCMERSPAMIVGLLGILQAGGAYVPLDPEYPRDRLAYMLQDTRVGIVLTQERLRARVSPLLAPAAELIALDEQWPEIADYALMAKANNVALSKRERSENLAYVIYTSGSTGKPKGVMVEHRCVVNHNNCTRRQYGITAQDAQIQFSSLSFDLFAEEVFVILLSGARLILEQKESLLSLDDFAQLLRSRQVTVLNLPTAFFHQWIASEAPLGGVRKVIVGGE
jgi:non-ribosomal peptide synthetase component F